MSEDAGSKGNNEDLKSKILSSINTTFTGEATSRWITAMKDDAFDEVEEVVPSGEGSRLHFSMAALIDRLFDNFKRYSFEFNRTQESREYEISCERPASMRTTAEYAEAGKPIKYCLGHLASRNWALIIQGEDSRILAYITPIEFMVGFKPGMNDFPPHLEMNLVKDPARASRDQVWAIGGKILALDSLPVLARRLFTQLVKVSKGESEHTEVFTMSPQEEKLAVAQTANVPVDRTFEDPTQDLLGQKKPLAERTFIVTPEPAEIEAIAEPDPKPDAPVTTDARPPLNAMLSPAPMPSLAASSSYPQVAAAIANGEPKALNAPPHPLAAEKPAAPFPNIPPIPVSLPQAAPAPTLLAEPSQLSEDAAIAALIFPEPPRAAGSPPPEPLPAQVPTAVPVPVAVSLPPFVTREAEQPTAVERPQEFEKNSKKSQTFSEVFSEPPTEPTPVAVPASEVKTEIKVEEKPEVRPEPIPEPKPEPAAKMEAKSEPAPAPIPNALADLANMILAKPVETPEFAQSVTKIMAPQPNNLEITGQHSGGKNNVAETNGKPSLEKESADAKRNVAQSLKGLFDSVDGAISGLTAVGLEAMHGDDIETVSAVMKQTKALKSLRESVVTLSKDWQKSIE